MLVPKEWSELSSWRPWKQAIEPTGWSIGFPVNSLGMAHILCTNLIGFRSPLGTAIFADGFGERRAAHAILARGCADVRNGPLPTRQPLKLRQGCLAKGLPDGRAKPMGRMITLTNQQATTTRAATRTTSLSPRFLSHG